MREASGIGVSANVRGSWDYNTLDLCCFGNSLAKNFNPSWRISKNLEIGLSAMLRTGMCKEDRTDVDSEGASHAIG